MKQHVQSVILNQWVARSGKCFWFNSRAISWPKCDLSLAVLTGSRSLVTWPNDAVPNRAQHLLGFDMINIEYNWECYVWCRESCIIDLNSNTYLLGNLPLECMNEQNSVLSILISNRRYVDVMRLLCDICFWASLSQVSDSLTL